METATERFRSVACGLAMAGVLAGFWGTNSSAVASHTGVEEQGHVCEDIMGCSGGAMKCAEFRYYEGGFVVWGTCYEDLEPN